MQALHYVCLMNHANVHKLASCGGLAVVKAAMDTSGAELTVQEHGCMLMAELACRESATAQEVLDCIMTVSNVARLQLQEK